MLDWDKLRVFFVVAEAGSFTTAGKHLGVSQSAMSRQIRALEERLGVSLFTRHARGLVLTQEGRKLFKAASDMSHSIEEIERDLRAAGDRPTGLLRVTTTVTFGAVWLTPHLNLFMAQYPEIDLQLLLSDEDLDLSAGQADVAIMLHDPDKADLIQRPLVAFHAHLYASPDYLDRKGTPVTADDLDRHDLITFGSSASKVIRGLDRILQVGDPTTKRKPRLQINNLYGVMHAVEAGMGIAILPDYLAHNRRSMVRVLPNMQEQTFHSYFCYPPELKGSARIGLFRDFLVRQIREERNIL